MIRKKGDQWCVFSKDGSKSLGCGPSEAWAKKRLQQVEFFKRNLESSNLEADVKLALTDDEILFNLADTTCRLDDDESDKEVVRASETMVDIIHSAPIMLAEEVTAAPEVESEKWIDTLMDGEYVSMDGQDVQITPDKIAQIIKNFKTGARGQDVPITIDHPDRGGAAGGWVRKLRKITRNLDDGTAKTVLQSLVKWTPLGREKVGNGEYRYVSAELLGDILRAVSLVNFPAIKGMQPITNLAETENERHIYLTGGDNMAKNTKPAEERVEQPPETDDDIMLDALAERIVNRVEEMVGKGLDNDEAPPAEEEPKEDEELVKLMAQMNKSISKDDALVLIEAIADKKLQPLAEENRKLTAQLESATEQVSQLMNERRIMRLQEKVATAVQLDRTRRFSSKVAKLMEEAILAEPTAYEEKVFNLLEALKAKDAIVDLNELGSAESNEDDVPQRGTKEWSDRTNRLAEKIMAEEKVDYKSAAKKAAKLMVEKGGQA